MFLLPRCVDFDFVGFVGVVCFGVFVVGVCCSLPWFRSVVMGCLGCVVICCLAVC